MNGPPPGIAAPSRPLGALWATASPSSATTKSLNPFDSTTSLPETAPATAVAAAPLAAALVPAVPLPAVQRPVPPRRGVSYENPIWSVAYPFTATRPGELSVNAGDMVIFDGVTPDGAWTYCYRGEDRGIVPTTYLEQPARCVVKNERARAPLGFDYGRVDGYARDVVAVRSLDGTRAPCTMPVARFNGSSAARIGERVQVYVDGRASFEMRLGAGGAVIGLLDGSVDLADLAPHVLKQERSAFRLRYEHNCGEEMVYCESTLWVWRANDVVVVSDVDGTVTKSDVRGHWNTTVRQKIGLVHRGYAHEGLCALFDHIVASYTCRMLYLTARPLDLSVETRGYLETLEQGGRLLPSGPVVTDSTTYYGSLKREVLDKTSHLFKTDYLLGVKSLFARAGRDVARSPVFMIAFGNKDTDALAYEAVGVPKVLTFLIDARSVVRCRSGYAREVDRYDDAGMMAWIDEMTSLFLRGRLPEAPVHSS